jgi:cysteinyl-tRNA synthetase
MALVAELGRSDLDPGSKAATLKAWDGVLGLDLDRPADRTLPDGAEQLMAEREEARAAKDFARADRLRERLRSLGVSVADKPVEK